MKFTKTVVAVAVTGLFAVPLAASAETTLSGVIEIKYQGTDEDGDAGDPDMAAGDVRVAINSQQALTSGLTGYGNIQFNLDDLTGEGGPAQATSDTDPQGDEDAIEIDSSATVASDNIYVGVKGAFGDVRVGDIPLAIEYGQLANDIYDIGLTVPDGISYTGAFGPVGLIANYALEKDSDMAGVGAKFSLAGATIGLGYELRNLADEEVGNLAVGAAYAIAGFSISAHYALLENTLEQAGIDIPAELAAGDSDATIAAVQVGYGIAGVNLGVTYQLVSQDDFDFDLSSAGGVPVTGQATNLESSVIRFDAGYDLGGGLDISTRVSLISNDGNFDIDASELGNDNFVDEDLTEYRVQLTKVF